MLCSFLLLFLSYLHIVNWCLSTVMRVFTSIEAVYMIYESINKLKITRYAQIKKVSFNHCF